MAFELKMRKGASGHEAEIRSVDSQNLSGSFIEVVKQCVAKKVLDITVNLNGAESAFGDIKASVLKLHQFVSSKGFKLKIIGDNLSRENFEELQKNGIVIVRQALTANFQMAMKAFEETGKLLADPSLVTEAEVQKNHYNELLERSEKLSAEVKSFRAHKGTIAKNKVSLDSAKKELSKIQAYTEKNKSALDEIAKKKAELADLTAKLEEEEKRLKDFIVKSDQENKKKEDSIKKEFEGEKNRFNKVEQDFTKKSEARLLEIKKLQSQPNDPSKK